MATDSFSILLFPGRGSKTERYYKKREGVNNICSVWYKSLFQLAFFILVIHLPKQSPLVNCSCYFFPELTRTANLRRMRMSGVNF